MAMGQLALLGRELPGFDATFSRLREIELAGGAFLDHAPGWLSGHAVLFECLLATTRWRTSEEHLYGKVVTAPRLVATLPNDGPGHPLLESIQRSLSSRYGEELSRTTLALYRDGRDSVAWHGDRVARRMDSALVATISLGAPRRFQLRPRGGGSSSSFMLGWGDLFVMRGSCQRLYQHAVPKVAHAEPRIALMLRPDWTAAPGS